MTYERPEKLQGSLTKYPMPCGSLFVIVGVDAKGYPREVFGEGSKHGTCRAWIEAGSRLATKLLQESHWDAAVDALSEIKCPACSRQKGRLLNDKDAMLKLPLSCADAVARELTVILEERKGDKK